MKDVFCLTSRYARVRKTVVNYQKTGHILPENAAILLPDMLTLLLFLYLAAQ